MDASRRANVVHETLCRVFRVSLEGKGEDGRVVLADLAEELRQERGGEMETGVVLDHDVIERLIMERLSQPPNKKDQRPMQYLVECYARAQDESRRAERYKDKEFAQQVQKTMEFARELVVSYSGILLQTGMFPQTKEAQARGTLQLLDCMMDPSGSTLPAGFLEQFVARFEGEGLQEMFEPIVRELTKSVVQCSLLGDFHAQIRTLSMLTNHPALCKVITSAKDWIPQSSNGRQFEQQSLLGPTLTISAIPDMVVPSRPSVGKTCFSDLENKRNADVLTSITTLRNAAEVLASTLHVIHMNLLRKGDRQRVLEYFSTAINRNEGRAKMQIDMRTTASHGYMINLGTVLLKICEPFVNDRGGKFSRIDPDYVTHGRVNFSGDTKLAATSEEEATWIDRRNASRVENFRNVSRQLEKDTGDEAVKKLQKLKDSEDRKAPGDKEFHFVCESFFLTARCLHLGLARCIRYQLELIKAMQKHQQALEELQASHNNSPSDRRTPQALMRERRITELKTVISEYQELRLCFDALLMDPAMLRSSFDFYRCLAAWLLKLASPAVARGAPIEFPLPSSCPMEFATLPEHFVDDITTVLLYTVRTSPDVLNSVQNELADIIDFLVVFVGSPHYIKNPYKRADMVEVLHACIPRDSQHGMPPPKSVQLLLEVYPLAVKHLVPNLLKLYVDIEFTGSHTQFYDKFNIRHNIGEILEYLWGVQAHRQEWCRVALEREGSFYLKFLNMLINDAIYLLDESVKKLPEVRQTLQAMSNSAAWQAQPARERDEREASLRQTEQILRSDLYLASVHLRMLQYTSAEITVPFLCPEMVDRIASMLDYFLVQFLEYLSGSRTMELHGLEKYGFVPSELLSRLADIFINLFSKDKENSLAAAIARDGRSYHDGLFDELAKIAREYFLLTEDKVMQMESLGARVAEAKASEMDDEEMLGDVPDEFLDPIQYTLMKEPVKLPTSGVTLDKATIMRHLLSDPTDPFNRKPLSPEMLVPEDELKASINKWIAEQKGKARQ
eukprot:scaffold938_cov334-Pavlova_lutheri.AAC.43